MKSPVAILALCSMAVLCTPSQAALPKLGYYLAHYSADRGTSGCAVVTSNTKQVKVDGNKLTYFEFTRSDGVQMSCLPKLFSDTDGTDSDGDPTRLITISGGTAVCTTADGSVSAPVEFDGTHIFWGGESMGRVTTPDGVKALVLQRERQSNYLEFSSTTGCP